MSADTTPAVPDFILKFEGELTPEQLAMWRALWEAAVNVTEPEGFRVWKAGVAHGRHAEREACAQLAETEARYWTSHGNTMQAAPLRVFADLIRKRGAQ